MNRDEKFILTITAGSHLSVHCFMLVFPSILLVLKNEFSVGLDVLGFIATLSALMFGIGAIPSGYFESKIGGRVLLLIYQAGTIVATMVIVMSQSLWMLTTGLALLGLFCSIYHPAGLTLISRRISNISKGMALHGIAGSLGLALAPVIAASFTTLFSWRAAYGILALVNFVLGSRIIDMSENIGTDAVIYKTANSVSISANGNIAGIQLTVSANNLQINENIPMTVESNLVGDQHIILMYGLNGETFSGDKIQLFTASEDYKISSIIAANILSKAMNIEQRNGLLPETFELSQNFPNPFNPSTDIQFTVGKDALISLNIFDIQGRLVSSLVDNSFYSSGSYKITWDGNNQHGTQVPSGMYMYKLVSEHQTVSRKMVLMK